MKKSAHSGLIVGLTGQTGAGKSTVSELIRQRGYPVIDADLASRQVTKKGSPCLLELTAAFGDEILNPDGTLNRKKLANIAFSDDAKRETLNKITHPHIINEIFGSAEKLLNNDATAVFIDAPTLFESGADALCDKVVSVIAPEGLRLSRIISRDNLSEAEALSRISAQHDDSFYTARSDYVITNSQDPESLANAVDEMLSSLLIPHENGAL